MKKSDKLIPVLFDDKDIIVDVNFWCNLFDEADGYVPWCVSFNNMEAMFFLKDLPVTTHLKFNAIIPSPTHNEIHVNAIHSEGTIFPEQHKMLDEIFMSCNKYHHTDIYCEAEVLTSTRVGDYGRCYGIKYKYYHTTEEV